MHNEILKKIKALSRSKKIVSKKELFSLCTQTTNILQQEVTSYRRNISIAEDIPGGLLDFTNSEKKDVIVVPDIHARKELIYKMLLHVLEDGKTVFEKLEEQSVIIIFLGDLLHSENLQKERWFLAFEEWQKGNCISDAMTAEMCDGLSVLEQVMVLKNAFVKNVHCLKGNHENIKNETANGNFSFHKIVMEGQMVYDFMQEKYGQKIINAISSFELSLPIVAIFDNFIVSHAEPQRVFTKEDIIESVINTDIIAELTWTKNGDVKEKTAEKIFNLNCKKNKIEKKYITGHRPVKGKYNLRQDGDVVQIHNPAKMQFCYIKAEKAFNPDSDIIVLN